MHFYLNLTYGHSANKKLIDLKTTVDPPAQHGRLGDVIRKIAKPKGKFLVRMLGTVGLNPLSPQ